MYVKTYMFAYKVLVLQYPIYITFIIISKYLMYMCVWLFINKLKLQSCSREHLTYDKINLYNEKFIC